MGEKKKNNKILIIINIVALIIIIGVIGYLVYDKYFSKPNGLRGMGAMNFNNMDIEEICANQQDKQTRSMPENMPEDFNPEQMPEKEMPDDVDMEKMQEQRQLIEEICEDGEVSEEEKNKFEEFNK